MSEHLEGGRIRRLLLLVFLRRRCVLLERLHFFDVLEHDDIDVVLFTKQNDRTCQGHVLLSKRVDLIDSITVTNQLYLEFLHLHDRFVKQLLLFFELGLVFLELFLVVLTVDAHLAVARLTIPVSFLLFKDIDD